MFLIRDHKKSKEGSHDVDMPTWVLRLHGHLRVHAMRHKKFTLAKPQR